MGAETDKKSLSLSYRMMTKKIVKPKGTYLITHGGTAKQILPILEYREKRLINRLYGMEPHLQNTDIILIQMLARNLAKLQQFDEYFKKHGAYDAEGKIRDPYRVYFTCQKNIMRLCDMLGLSTESKVKLGLEWKRLEDNLQR